MILQLFLEGGAQGGDAAGPGAALHLPRPIPQRACLRGKTHFKSCTVLTVLLLSFDQDVLRCVRMCPPICWFLCAFRKRGFVLGAGQCRGHGAGSEHPRAAPVRRRAAPLRPQAAGERERGQQWSQQCRCGDQWGRRYSGQSGRRGGDHDGQPSAQSVRHAGGNEETEGTLCCATSYHMQIEHSLRSMVRC